MKTLKNLHVRWMIRKDMNEVLDIEHKSFARPWDEQKFIKMLRKRNCIGMVVEHGEQVVGYMIYELSKEELYITNFAVHPNLRRKGVGTKMIEKLISKLGVRRSRIICDIKVTSPAVYFFKALGFKATGEIGNAYSMAYQYYPALHEEDFDVLFNTDTLLNVDLTNVKFGSVGLEGPSPKTEKCIDIDFDDDEDDFDDDVDDIDFDDNVDFDGDIDFDDDDDGNVRI